MNFYELSVRWPNCNKASYPLTWPFYKKVYVQFNALLIMINTEFRSSGKDKIDIAKLTNPDGEQFASLFKKFVTVCREDLDIDDQLIDPADDEQFEEFVDLSTKMISDDLGVDQD